MKNLAILFFLITFTLTVFGQTPKPTPKKTPKPTKTVVPKLGTEAEEFEKAKAVTSATERIAALQEFIKNFPASTEIPNAQGLIVSARAELGVMKLQAKEIEAGVGFYKLAVQEAPTPVPDELFSKVLLGFPVSLYTLNERSAAFDIAKLIEEKVGANSGQILELSKFYLNAEYGTEAIRLAQRSVELAPDSANAYQVLATANRLNFRLEDAANAYSKSLELDGESMVNKISLAEMKRALGKTDEAIALYREMLIKDSANKAAQSGLTLALFEAGKRTEAEAELKKSLETDAENARLLTSVAYWYAAHGLGELAIEYSRKAIALEPRNVWSYIAQSRALLAQDKPLEAEKVLLAARQYSDFPTLDYELASARLAAGLYHEAAETLKRSFAVNKEGLVETYLGNRILADAKSFTELLSLERRTAIFETNAADNEDNTNQLKSLLEFNQKLEAKDATEEDLAQAADEFAKGGDNMRLHRQLFAASRLLQKKTALPKVLELMQSAIGGVDSALNVAAPAAAVLADEIYESRQYAISQNLVIVVPDIPRQTLSAILRGRIEDIAGWTYLQQNNPPQSIIRLKRALSVLPDKSAWSRASQWRLGTAFEADGKEKEALEAYIRSYDRDLPDAAKRTVIENLYQKLNGSLDGLEARIGQRSDSPIAATENKTAPTNTDNVKTTSEKMPYSVPVAEPSPKTPETPQPTPEAKTETKTELKTEPKTETNNLPENLPSVTPEKTPDVSPSPTPDEKPKTEEVKTETAPKTETSPSPTPTETLKTEIQPTATPETTPSPEPSPSTEEPAKSETKTEPTPQTSPTPQFVSDTKPEKLTQFPPSPKTTESKIENKTTADKTTADKTTEPTVLNPPKPLFEPVIITVGKTDAPKTENTETKTSDAKTAEPVQKNESAQPEKPNTENKPETKPETKPVENVTDEKLLSGENRPRIIITENTGTKTVTEEITDCKIIVNMETLSLLNSGGSLGVSVGFEDKGDLKQITAKSSSPDDVEVVLEPGIGENSGHLFFIIKSISTKTGAFTITFEAPCGKKEILVKVR